MALKGSSRSLTCCEIRVLLKVGYDEVAEDVEAGEEQGTDLQAEECGQCGHALRAALLPRLLPQVMPPALGLVSSTLFVFPLLALVTPHSCAQTSLFNGGCTRGSHMVAHKLAQHPGQGAENPPRSSGSARAGKSVAPWDIPELPDPTALALLAPAPSRATGTALKQAPRTSTVSLPPPLERRGQARAGDVQETRRPFIPLGTRQDEERSPESSTLA